VRHPEVGALQDALLGQEAFAVLEPRHHALGGAADRIEDRLLGFGLREQRFELRAREAEVATGLVDEGAHFGALHVDGGRGRNPGKASEERGGRDFEQDVSHQLSIANASAISDRRVSASRRAT
jgi:hypothetical protein